MNDNFEISSIDRRSLLKKAAAAGAVAWTAPLVISSPALAGSCTLACAIPSFTPALQGEDICGAKNTDQAANLLLSRVDSVINADGKNIIDEIDNANKISVITIVPLVTTDPPIYCGCTNTLPLPGNVYVSGIPDVFYKNGVPPLPSIGCPPITNQPDLTTISLKGTGYIGANGATEDNSFIANKSGANQTAIFTTDAPICISVGCYDDDDVLVFRNCTFSGMCFTYNPAGNCATSFPVDGNFGAVIGQCAVSCTPC